MKCVAPLLWSKEFLRIPNQAELSLSSKSARAPRKLQMSIDRCDCVLPDTGLASVCKLTQMLSNN